MPVTEAAKKKQKRDQKRRSYNLRVQRRMKEAIKEVKESPTEENRDEAFKAIDKAAKKNIIHKNKAARLKSKISKQVS